MNFYKLNPDKLIRKYKLEDEIQNIWFNENNINYKYLEPLYSKNNQRNNQRFFFNKILTIINSINSEKTDEFFIDNDILIKPSFLKKIKSSYFYFFTCNDTYDWNQKLLQEYQKKKISKKALNFFLKYINNINIRISASIIDLKLLFFIKNEFYFLKKELNLTDEDFISYSWIDELILSKIYFKQKKNRANLALFQLKLNEWKNDIYIIHFQNPFKQFLLLNKKNLKNKKLLKICFDLEKYYKGFKK